MAVGNASFIKDIIDDTNKSIRTTYSSDRIESLLGQTGASSTVYLLTVGDVAPASPSIHDKYYNTIKGLVYEFLDTNKWDNGTNPSRNTLYVDLEHSKMYLYEKGKFVECSGITKISPRVDNALEKITGSINPSEDGLYVKDLEPEINLINQTTKINKEGVQEYLCLVGTVGPDGYSDKSDAVNVVINGKYDLFYLLRNENLQTTIDDTSRYDFSKNGTSHLTGSYITLKAGVTYKIQVNILSSAQGSYYIYDENDKSIGNRGYTGTSLYSDSNVFAIVKYNKDTKIFIKYTVTSTPAGGGKLYPSCSFIKIESMSYLTIDPLQYVDNTNGTQDTPVGTIINVMGNNAPKHYLKCDGAEYNIADYPYLAEYFRAEFGSINKFGGDGVTTFRTPDLKGEFLRGTGTNGHTNQGSGAAVGTHQDATFILDNVVENKTGKLVVPYGNNNVRGYNFEGKNDPAKSDAIQGSSYLSSLTRVSAKYVDLRATRPTNTSVLYCIKAEPTYFINVIGTTIKNELLDTPIDISFPTGTDFATDINTNYTLNNNIENYDKIEIKYGINTGEVIGNPFTRTVDIDDIRYASAIGDSSFNGEIQAINASGYFVGEFSFSFVDNVTIKILRSALYSISGTKPWTTISITSIKGIKETSAVQGGNFGGTGSSCTCENPTDADIEAAINSSITELNK